MPAVATENSYIMPQSWKSPILQPSTVQSHCIISTAFNPTWIKHRGHAHKHSSESIDTALAVSHQFQVLASSRFQHDLYRSPREKYCQARAQSRRSFINLFFLCIHLCDSTSSSTQRDEYTYRYTIVHEASCLLHHKPCPWRQHLWKSLEALHPWMRNRLAGKGFNTHACHALHIQPCCSMKQVQVAKFESERESTCNRPSFSHSIAKSKVFDESVGLPRIVSRSYPHSIPIWTIEQSPWTCVVVRMLFSMY